MIHTYPTLHELILATRLIPSGLNRMNSLLRLRYQLKLI